MIVRVKEVIAITRAGSNASTVNSSTIRSGWANDAPPAIQRQYRRSAAPWAATDPKRTLSSDGGNASGIEPARHLIDAAFMATGCAAVDLHHGVMRVAVISWLRASTTRKAPPATATG